MAIDPDIQPHLDALTDRIVRVEARATQAEQDLAIIEPSIAQLEQTVAALEQTPGLLSADPDTSDGWSAQPQSATLVTEQPDGSVTRSQVQRVSLREVYDPDTSDELATEARRLLDAATPGPWTHPSPTANWFTVPQPIQIDEADWGQETQENGAMCGYRIGTLADERAWRYADAELIAAAPRLIAALLAERDADVSAGAVARTVAMSHIAAERDAERVARERAEAEARQLREAIGDPDELIANAHYGRAANGHGDDLFATVSRIAAAVAEGAEDRGQTDG